MCEPRMTNACKYGDTYFFHPLFQYVRDILLLNGPADTNLSITAGRLFGLTNGYLPNSEFYTGNSPMIL